MVFREVPDVHKAINDDDAELEDMDEKDDSELHKLNRRNCLNREMYNYRHWLSLTPPSNTLIEAVAEDEKRDAVHREYEERTKCRS